MNIKLATAVLTTVLAVVSGTAQAQGQDCWVAPRLGADSGWRAEAMGYAEMEGYKTLVIDAVAETQAAVEQCGYTRLKLWIDPALSQVRSLQGWDRDGRLLRTVWLREFNQDGQLFQAHEVEVIDHSGALHTVFRLMSSGWVIEQDDALNERQPSRVTRL